MRAVTVGSITSTVAFVAQTVVTDGGSTMLPAPRAPCDAYTPVAVTVSRGPHIDAPPSPTASHGKRDPPQGDVDNE